MTITSYDSLKTALAAQMARSDLANDDMARAIQICEVGFHYGIDGMPPLRIRAMETSAVLTVDAESVALPTDYLAFRNIYLDTDPKGSLAYVTPEMLRRNWSDNATSRPVNFTIEGENILFGPAPDDSYSANVIYYKKLTPLSDSNATNWVLTNRPDIYLYGAMAELEGLLEGPNEAKYQARFVRAVNATNAQDKSDRHSGSTLVMRP